MFQKIKNNQILKSLFDSRNIGLYAVFIVALSVTWSSVKIIQKNYTLEKEILRLQQEVSISEQQNKNQRLKNEYFKTDAYLELAARKYFSKAGPGEKLILIPPSVAQSFTHPEAETEKAPESLERKLPTIIKNWQDWLYFFSHKDADN